jgi:ubiquinone biosynthesis protein
MSLYTVYGKLNRYRQIVEVLTRHQFGYLIDLLGISRFIQPRAKRRSSSEPTTVLNKWERTRMVLEDLGGTFIKMGQILSTRGDLLPRELMEELEKLQDDAPHFPFEEVRKTVEKDLNAGMDELFQSFEQVPLASASLGQVHRATLKTGEKLVIKVLRPEIRTSIQIDGEILLDAARFLEKRRLFKGKFNFVPLAEEIKDSLEGETDYVREAHNAERFRRNFADDPYVYVPDIYWGYTTSRLLCMEKIDGIKILDHENLARKGLDEKEIARRGIGAYLKQILVHGFFHADPHPGNLFVTYDGKIAFVDFGLVGEIDVDLRNSLGDLFINTMKRNIDGVIDTLLAIGSIPPVIDRIRMKKDLSFVHDKYSTLALKEIRVGEVIKDILQLMYHYGVKIPPDFTLMIKTVATLEGLGKQLDPDFNIFDVAEPYARELMRERIMSRWWFSDSLKSLQTMYNNAGHLITQLTEAFTTIQKGELKVHHEHQGLQRMINRLCFSMVIASMILGSSWLMASKTAHAIVGVAGLIAAGFLALWLLVSIARSGRL